MNVLRTFIAVDTPASLQNLIRQRTEPLRRTLDPGLVRWVRSQNLHLTLKFLGDVSPAGLEPLAQAIQLEAQSIPEFELQVGGLGAFPNTRRPRVIFIGIQAPPGLARLQRALEAACARLGYPPEDRAFSPHLTIGRVRPDLATTGQHQLQTHLAQVSIDALGTARVDSVHLYKSDLQPGGSVYAKLYSARLAGSSHA